MNPLAEIKACLTDASVDRLRLRETIARAQAALFDVPDHLEGDCFPLDHSFAPGVYARTITLPADSVIVGKLHRHAHHNFIQRGKVSVLTEEGPKTLQGPCHFVSFPGTKRVVYAHEETVWTTIHPTESTDLAEIEKEVIAPDYASIGLADPVSKIGGEP